MQKIDVVIIGGGPAGLSTAMHLVQRSPDWASRILVLEKETHPRPKLCGGGITPFGLAQLQKLDLELDIPYARVQRVVLSYLDLEAQYRAEPAVVVVDRPAFDAWLLNHARARGVEVREGCTVSGVERREDGILVHTSSGDYLAEVVVGADGSTGKTRRWLVDGASPLQRDDRRAASRLGPQLRSKPGTARVLEVFSAGRSAADGMGSEILFRFDPALKDVQGYFWRFPSVLEGKPAYNFGIYDARLYRRTKADLPAVLSEELGEDPFAETAAMDSVQGAPIRLFKPWSSFSAERVVLAGDAAGVDPVFGEGISLALAYGEKSADQVEKALGTSRTGLHRPRQGVSRARFGFRRKQFGFRGYRRSILFSGMGRYLTLRWLLAEIGYRIAHSRWKVRAVWWIVRLLARWEPRSYR